MSKRHLRQDPVCQNCGERVEKRFCGHCGQENTEIRQSFGHLLRHFIEDLTHYDGAFWRTIKYLLFRPAYLTKEFLKGKRASFVPPVRLYIFISFITFLLPYVLPSFFMPDDVEAHVPVRAHDSDTVVLKSVWDIEFHMEEEGMVISMPNLYTSVRQMDSIEAGLPESQRLGFLESRLYRKYIPLQKYSKYDLGERFLESFNHNIPKVLFVFMPLFALALWLFHGKNRWLYFDHAIFTLHYFSFILLVVNVLALSDTVATESDTSTNLQVMLLFTVMLAIFVYFFMAHKRMYGESRFVSFTKAFFIYAISVVIFSALLLFFAFISLLSIH